jgi:hypothetical protein
MERKLINIIEKFIKLRIDNIIEKSDLDIETSNKIKDINKNIESENKIKKIKINRKNKKNIPKDEKVMNPYTLYIKDATNIMKEELHLNYLEDEDINRIKKCKDKKRNEQFKELSIIWNKLDNNKKDKYVNLCQNRDFSNIKYKETVENLSSSKIKRKKKSKESLKSDA